LLFPRADDYWHLVVPFAHSGKAFGAFLLGFCLPRLINAGRKGRRVHWIREAIKHFGNDLEILLLRSMDTETAVLLTLGTGKVYVGYVVRLFNPDVERKHIRLLPVMSGYRSEKTQEVSFTTFYDVVREMAHDPASDFYGLLEKDFEIV